MGQLICRKKRYSPDENDNGDKNSKSQKQGSIPESASQCSTAEDRRTRQENAGRIPGTPRQDAFMGSLLYFNGSDKIPDEVSQKKTVNEQTVNGPDEVSDEFSQKNTVNGQTEHFRQKNLSTGGQYNRTQGSISESASQCPTAEDRRTRQENAGRVPGTPRQKSASGSSVNVYDSDDSDEVSQKNTVKEQTVNDPDEVSDDVSQKNTVKGQTESSRQKNLSTGVPYIKPRVSTPTSTRQYHNKECQRTRPGESREELKQSVTSSVSVQKREPPTQQNRNQEAFITKSARKRRREESQMARSDYTRQRVKGTQACSEIIPEIVNKSTVVPAKYSDKEQTESPQKECINSEGLENITRVDDPAAFGNKRENVNNKLGQATANTSAPVPAKSSVKKPTKYPRQQYTIPNRQENILHDYIAKSAREHRCEKSQRARPDDNGQRVKSTLQQAGSEIIPEIVNKSTVVPAKYSDKEQTESPQEECINSEGLENITRVNDPAALGNKREIVHSPLQQETAKASTPVPAKSSIKKQSKSSQQQFTSTKKQENIPHERLCEERQITRPGDTRQRVKSTLHQTAPTTIPEVVNKSAVVPSKHSVKEQKESPRRPCTGSERSEIISRGSKPRSARYRSSGDSQKQCDTRQKIQFATQEQVCKTVLKDVDASPKETILRKFQDLLIKHYSSNHNLTVIPLIEDSHKAHITDLYVDPPMESTEDIKQRIQCRIGQPVTSYKQLLFSSHDLPCQTIFVTGEPGIGKTSLCKRLCAAWCQAHKPRKLLTHSFSTDDVTAMRYFEFLFYISLRETDNIACDIDAVVYDIIDGFLSICRTKTEYCRTILEEKSCLIVLDGLDELNPPGNFDKAVDYFPNRKYRPNNTVLITTRPWKLNVISLSQIHIGRHVHIKELTEKGSKILRSKLVKFLNEITGQNKYLDQQHISLLPKTFLCNPYIYQYCILLSFEGRSVGNSKSEILSNIIEFILERAIQKRGPPRSDNKNTNITRTLPACLEKLEHCSQLRGLFSKVGELAFASLINNEKGQMLIMNDKFTGKYLTQEELILCLDFGLLNQERAGLLSHRESNVSFNHKIIHEFFAALYLYLAGQKELDMMVQKCNSLSDLLEMSNIFVFISGFDSELYYNLSCRIVDTVIQDNCIARYRQSCYYDEDSDFKLVLNLQNLQTECAREMELNGHDVPPIPLQDIIINKDTKNNYTLSLVQKIIRTCPEIIKSLYVYQCETTNEAAEILKQINLHSLQHLQKLFLPYVRDLDKEQILFGPQTRLQSLSFVNIFYSGNRYERYPADLSPCFREYLQNLLELQALYLDSVSLDYAQLQQIVEIITLRNMMTRIGLYKIICKGRDGYRNRVVLDLSRHSNLVQLHLHGVHVSQVNLNTQHLEEIVIGGLETNVVKSLIRRLPEAHLLQRLSCNHFTDDTLADMVVTIPKLLQLENLHIQLTNIDDRLFLLSPEMTRLRRIELWRVSMCSTVLEDLAKTLLNLSLSVIVHLKECKVTPMKDFLTWKNIMKSSKQFVVFTDRLDSNDFLIYTFETNP